MKKLFVLIILGMVFFIGGQWIGLEVQHRQIQQDSPENPSSGNASAEEGAHFQNSDPLPSTVQ